MTQIYNWCKMMFIQKSGQVSLGKKPQAKPEVVSTDPIVRVEENTIFLNRREASFINKEVHRILKEKIAEEERRKKKGIPSPPEPGKITYAVYQ